MINRLFLCSYCTPYLPPCLESHVHVLAVLFCTNLFSTSYTDKNKKIYNSNNPVSLKYSICRNTFINIELCHYQTFPETPDCLLLRRSSVTVKNRLIKLWKQCLTNSCIASYLSAITLSLV